MQSENTISRQQFIPSTAPVAALTAAAPGNS
jgi:hypothetical protein